MNKNDLYIIFCDDDTDDRDFFSLVAYQWAPQAEIKAVASATELVAELKDAPNADFIFLDLNMPEFSGLECLKMIRAEMEFVSVPLIIYSTSANPVDVDAAYNAGANLYVQKPTSSQGLIKILDKILALGKEGLWAHHQRKVLLKV